MYSDNERAMITSRRLNNALSIALNPSSSGWAKQYWQTVADVMGRQLQRDLNGS